MDVAEQRIFQLAQSSDRRGFVWIKEILWPTFEKIEQLQASQSSITGVPTGFHDLDEYTAGFQDSDLIIIAARPSMGKTAFVLNITQHAAIQAQKAVAFFSLEMSKESLVQRVLCAEARVDASRLRRGRLTDDDYARLAIAAGHLNTAPIYIDDTPGISVLEMRAKARRLKSDRADLAMIVVDYLQLMVSPGKSESRQQEVSEISRGLKALAKELEIPVVALSQLSRAVESRPDKRPMMSDLRESGAIEQDADVIMFLYRPEYYFGPTDKEGNSIEGKAELIIGKQRNGATGNLPLFFRKEFTLFESVSHNPREEH
jgi:replicative DNA helicase